MNLIGIHIDSNPRNLLLNANFAKEIGANIVQIFINPKTSQYEYYEEFSSYLQNNNMTCVVHGSYTINIASIWDENSPHILQLIDEIIFADKIGAKFIVLHMGKQLELSKEEAFNNMYSSLLHVALQVSNTKLTVLLETSSGQGSETCSKLQDLALFYKKISKHPNNKISRRFGICVDTCHIFAAGYNIKNKNTINMFLDTFEELIGIRHIKLIHFNDSKKDIGSNVDRHENIGKGYIGKEGLLIFAKYFKNLNIPILLETKGNMYQKEIKFIQTI